MRTIHVEPEQLIHTATRIDNENDLYRNALAMLMNAIDTMEGGWKGKDNTAFSSQIRKYDSELREMSVLCTQYSEFLRNAANAYREAQDTIASQASRLGQ